MQLTRPLHALRCWARDLPSGLVLVAVTFALRVAGGALPIFAATDNVALPGAAQGPISAALGRDEVGYWFQAKGGGFHGENPRQSLVADFTAQGVQIRFNDRLSQGARWGLALRGY